MPLYCKNCPPARKKTYTGKEPSPKGFGYCASCGSYGQQMLGKDGQLWVIRQRINGSLYWAKVGKGTPERPIIAPRKTPTRRRVSSPKRKRGSVKRKSPKRKSPKRKSPKRKRGSVKRKSPKRKT